jgi:hypothetical protein
MKQRLTGVAALGAAVALTIAGVAFADHPGGGGAPLGASLTGAAECNAAGTACGLGDPNATGTVLFRMNPGREEVCFDVTTANADPFFASHIHRAPAGIAGDIVVPTTGAFSGSTSACVHADRELILAIMQNPEGYYYNAHNTAFPGGALRGQLGHVAPGQ